MKLSKVVALTTTLLYALSADVLAVRDRSVSSSIDKSSAPPPVVASKKTNTGSKPTDRVLSSDLLSSGTSLGKETDSEDGTKGGSSNPFVMSVSMIIVSEIGDKTFLIAALMAMKLSRLIVFTALFAALAIMTILSGIVGHTLPALIPQQYTQFLAGVLFIVFGYKLLREGLAMSKDIGVDEEMAEVEEEIAMSDINQRMESQESAGGELSSPKQNLLQSILSNVKDLFSFVLSPIWVQVFVMTFLGEWGDRSQIATIAMAAGSDYWLVIAGAIIGHGICTGGAVIGGKLLATRISMRNVTLGGSVAFFVFAILYFYEAVNGDHEQ